LYQLPTLVRSNYHLQTFHYLNIDTVGWSVILVLLKMLTHLICCRLLCVLFSGHRVNLCF